MTDLDYGDPTRYRIVVQGTLGREWSERLGGLSIETCEQPPRAPRTTLSGPLRDQAELQGVLDTLLGLHLCILEVARIDEDGSITTSADEPQTPEPEG